MSKEPQINRPVEGKAERPGRFSKEWWKLVGLVIKHSFLDFLNDNGPQWAAAISYYALLSAFPLALAVVSIGSYFVPEQTITTLLTGVLGDFLPDGEEEVQAIVTSAMDARVGVSAISILFLLWGGSRVFGVLTRALNIFYDVDEQYNFLQRTGIEILMLLSVGLLFVAAMASRVILGIILNESQIDNPGFFFRVLTQFIPFFMMLVSFFTIYRYVPRRSVHWKAALAGAVFIAVAYITARPLFWFYANEFAAYELVYGPIAILVVLVLWAWLVALFILFGGELVAHIQEMLIEGTPAEEVRNRHLLRSPFYKDRQKAKKSPDELLENLISGSQEGQPQVEHNWAEAWLPRDEKLHRKPDPRVQKSLSAFGGLSLLAALSSAALLVFNLRRKE